MNDTVKKGLYISLGIFLLIILVSGGTYAYFIATVSSNTNAVNLNSKNYNVVYSGGRSLEGNLDMSTDKSGGLSTTVTIKMSEDSVLPNASIYMDINNISNNLLGNGNPWQGALKWEIYAYDSSSHLISSNTGDFLKCSSTGNQKCSSGSKLYMLKNQKLAYTDITYYVYVWLDASLADNGANMASLRGYIGAETDQYTGKLVS